MNLACSTFLFTIIIIIGNQARTCFSYFLVQEQITNFENDGYLYIPNFFQDDNEMFQRFLDAGDAIVAQQQTDVVLKNADRPFSVADTGVIFDGGSSSYPNNSTDDTRSCSIDGVCINHEEIAKSFRDIALRSKLVQASAELMHLDNKNGSTTMRILRDVFLAKPINTETVCDWHVDDQLFWPETFVTTGSSSSSSSDVHDGYRSTGVNVWIAMDDMPYGGSMVVAPGSHTADWRWDAYNAIRQDRSQDLNLTREEYLHELSKATKNNTCNMNESDPTLREIIEKTKIVFNNIRKGDVIFADRLLFHRTIPVSNEGREIYNKDSNKLTLNRYSIRYVPGTARLPMGFNPETSIVADPTNAGKILDNVSDTLWYPVVYPYLENNIDEFLNIMNKDKYTPAKQLRTLVVQEFFTDIRTIMMNNKEK